MGLIFIFISQDNNNDKKANVDRMDVGIKRNAFGFIFLMSGAFILASDMELKSSVTNWQGIILSLLGIMILTMPYIRDILYRLEQMQEMRLVGGMLVMSVGSATLTVALIIGALSWYLGRDSTFLIIGLCLTLLGISILPTPYREDLFRFLRIPYKWHWRKKSMMVRIPKRKPKGFSKTGSREYGKIPEDAIEPYTEEYIHNLISQRRPIVRCKDCGAYYDEGVWNYYGKKCVRIGCSNSEF